GFGRREPWWRTWWPAPDAAPGPCDGCAEGRRLRGRNSLPRHAWRLVMTRSENMELVEVLERLLDRVDALDAAIAAPSAPAEAQPCGCGEAACTAPWEPGCGLGKSEQHVEAQAQGGGEVPEAELIALVAGPYHYHHKMDEAAEREGKAFDRCRELTIQNIRT